MAVKLFLASLFLILFPMMAIPFFPLKIPPIYQLLLIFLFISTVLFIIKKGKIKSDFFSLFLILLCFDIFLIFIKSSFSQILSISTYILILMTLKYYLSNSIYKNKLKIDQILFYIYIIMISYSLLQIIFYKIFGTMYLVNYDIYLTSGINSYTLNNPVSGWNKEFRPNAFFAEPSFLGFFVVVYSIYNYEDKKNLKFILMNIIILHLFGNRSGELVLILMIIYILFENILGKKKAILALFIFITLFIILIAINSEFISAFIDKDKMDFSTYERLFLLIQGIETFKNNLLFGVGLGRLKEFFQFHELYENSISNVGNLYIQLLAEIGIIGMLFLILILKRIYTHSLIVVSLLLSIFLVGSYNLLYMWVIPLLITIYKEKNIENTISK